MIQKKLLIFDNKTKEYTGLVSFCDKNILSKNYFYEECLIDTETQYIEGNSDNWIIKEKSDLIYESQLDFKCRNAIYTEYNIEKQLNIMSNVLLELSKASTSNSCIELKLMHDKITELKTSNKKLKEKYKNDKTKTYISIEDEHKRMLCQE